ncbi:MAG: AraC family transcriptional regulator [Treponema sp.]|nr:AraC family transcriptional regulator [Treponema sp.]
MVSVSDLTYRQPIEHISRDLPEYFHINLCRGTIQGIGGARVSNVHSRYTPAGFSHRSVGVSFLPEFFDSFFGLRHGISPDALTEALNALGRFPLIPEAAVILKQIGGASFTGDIGNAWIEAKTLELIAIVLDWHRHLNATTQPGLRENDRTGIVAAMRYAAEHCSEPITLALLAKQAAMSISKFTAAFKTHTGVSTASYIRRLRMDKAIDLLKNTSAPLGDIAGMVGYKHHARFSTLFREQFGVTPGSFRKKD